MLARTAPLTYFFALCTVQAELTASTLLFGFLRTWELVYLLGFVALDVFVSWVHPFYVAPKMAFLPLMATSVYCAVGVLYASYLAYKLWGEHSWGRAGARD